VDELHYKFSGLSVYNFAANSPILVIDSDGRENIIWLLVTDKAKNEETLQKNGTSAELIARQASDNFKLLGLKTEVRVFQGDAADFEILKMNLSKDAVAVIGADAIDTREFIRAELDPVMVKENLENWQGGALNPEVSENNPAKNKDGADLPENNGGNVIAIDGSGLGFYYQWVMSAGSGENIGTLAGALVINHGAGHNAGCDHNGDYGVYPGVLMEEKPSELGRAIRNKGYDGIFEPNSNKGYIQAMTNRFNAQNKPVDEYTGKK
jgi:hypothetical protein